MTENFSTPVPTSPLGWVSLINSPNSLNAEGFSPCPLYSYVEVLAWHPDWVDETWNPSGIRIGFFNDGGFFETSYWHNYQYNYCDGYQKVLPFKVMLMPLPPENI